MGTTAIEPTVGISGARFGMTGDEIERVLGEPDTVEESEYVGRTHENCWVFREAGLELYFSSDNNFRLTRITVQTADATLFGERLMGLSESAFRDVVAKYGVEPNISYEVPDLAVRELSWDQGELSFWFEKGILQNIGMLPSYDENGDSPRWSSA